MGYGVFGKVPFKRDFISRNIAKQILHPYEAWLQASVAASQNKLGREWETLYAVSPVWRFWFGRSLFGVSAAGVIMPCVDKVGRYFPITLIYQAPEESRILPPTIAPADDWYDSLETRVLTVLEPGSILSIDDIIADLQAPQNLVIESVSGLTKLQEATSIWTGRGEKLTEFIKSKSMEESLNVGEQKCLFWGSIGQEYDNVLISSNGLPDPYVYTKMIDFNYTFE